MFRGKFKVKSVESFESCMEVVKMSAVTNGSAEDNSFSRFTPSAELSMTITNPDLVGKIKAGQQFYADFILAED